MDAVKLVDVEKGLVEGWAIPFGGPMPGGKDLDGEAFTKESELYLDVYDKRPVLYFHGMDKALGVGPIGAEVKWEQKDGGIWLEAQLSKSGKYQEHVLELARRGLLGFSSGANPRSVVKSASGLIERWMWMETSLLPIPSNPFGMATMKALGASEPMPVSDQMQLCEKLGHFPDAGEVAVGGSGPGTMRSPRPSLRCQWANVGGRRRTETGALPMPSSGSSRHWAKVNRRRWAVVRRASSRSTTSRLLSMAAHPSLCPTPGHFAGATTSASTAVSPTERTPDTPSWWPSSCPKSAIRTVGYPSKTLPTHP